jgi:ABC-type branched-subunit amino acid transport system ATPase component
VSESIDLELDAITVRYGGLLAVDGVSLRAPAGAVTGLIGPNGAGKTTLFDATCGVTSADAGAVRLGGRDLRRLGPAGRASVGLGRTFQRMRLFDSMTVLENVAAGPELRRAGRRPWTHLWATRADAAAVRDGAAAAIERCGLGAIAGRNAGDLSTGQRRLVELARAIASGFAFLLLDEPSSGLDVDETQRFVEILRSVQVDDGIGILVVEHDMALVRALCSAIYVLDFGRMICSGPAAEVLASDIVRDAYLGSDAVEEALADA